MQDQTIQCPHCQQSISLTESLTKDLRSDFEQQFAKEREVLERQLREEHTKKEAEFANKLGQLKEQEQQIKQAEAAMEQTLAVKLQEEKKKLWDIAQEKAKERAALEVKELQERTHLAEEKLKQAQEEELALRRQKRELEERERTLALEMEKQLEKERNELVDKARKEAEEGQRLKTLEYQKQMEMMRRQIEDLKQKSEQGSQQLQGEVQEADLKALLQQQFVHDRIEDVPTGIRGADLIQHVQMPFGQTAGIILWESKNTKTWGGDWIKKLRDDQGLASADICVLVSRVLPEGITSFGEIDGVWITKYEYLLPLTHALRMQLLSLQQLKAASIGKEEKMQLLYEYLSGTQFKHKVETIVQSFTGLKQELESEKRAYARIWNRREKEIDRVIMNTSGLYGDLQGIIGNTLPRIDALEVPLLEDIAEEE